MIVKGKEVRNIEVEVNPLEVVETLLGEARKLLKKTPDRGIKHDYSTLMVVDGKIIEIYVEEGYSYGHYEKDDKEVYRIDRSRNYDKGFLDYIVSLDKVSKYLRSKGYE